MNGKNHLLRKMTLSERNKQGGSIWFLSENSTSAGKVFPLLPKSLFTVMCILIQG